MLRFSEGGGRVRTASVWQVRSALHQRSIERWRHYAAHLEGIRERLADGGAFDDH
jgi:hypothetical protein